MAENIQNLPTEIMPQIFRYIHPLELSKLYLVNKDWNTIASSENTIKSSFKTFFSNGYKRSKLEQKYTNSRIKLSEIIDTYFSKDPLLKQGLRTLLFDKDNTEKIINLFKTCTIPSLLISIRTNTIYTQLISQLNLNKQQNILNTLFDKFKAGFDKEHTIKQVLMGGLSYIERQADTYLALIFNQTEYLENFFKNNKRALTLFQHGYTLTYEAKDYISIALRNRNLDCFNLLIQLITEPDSPSPISTENLISLYIEILTIPELAAVITKDTLMRLFEKLDLIDGFWEVFFKIPDVPSFWLINTLNNTDYEVVETALRMCKQYIDATTISKISDKLTINSSKILKAIKFEDLLEHLIKTKNYFNLIILFKHIPLNEKLFATSLKKIIASKQEAGFIILINLALEAKLSKEYISKEFLTLANSEHEPINEEILASFINLLYSDTEILKVFIKDILAHKINFNVNNHILSLLLQMKSIQQLEDPIILANLGFAYMDGKLVQQNYNQAKNFFTRAKELGYPLPDQFIEKLVTCCEQEEIPSNPTPTNRK